MDEALKLAQQIHDHLTPQTSAYAEIWLDGEKLRLSEKKQKNLFTERLICHGSLK